MKNLKLFMVSLVLLFSYFVSVAQGPRGLRGPGGPGGEFNKNQEKSGVASALSGFKFRSIGPAFMSGRISDIAIDPKNENIWYVAVASGGAWKTENAGTTWRFCSLRFDFVLCVLGVNACSYLFFNWNMGRGSPSLCYDKVCVVYACWKLIDVTCNNLVEPYSF